MISYSFTCSECSYAFICQNNIKEGAPTTPRCPSCAGHKTTRNFRADYTGVDLVVPGYMSAKNTTNKSDFLPSTKDYESPSDPTGENGFKEWKATHVVRGSRWV